MKVFVVLSVVLAAGASAMVVAKDHVSGDSQDMGGDYSTGNEDISGREASSYASIGQSSGGYGKKCTPYYDTVKVDRCEQYSEKVCTTSHVEKCEDVQDKNCRAIVSSQQVRKCFNVTELLCGLKEQVKYDTIQAVTTVQKCHKVTQRVCDTVYEPDTKSQDDFQCITLWNPYCTVEDKTVTDKICRSTTRFDCPTHGDEFSGYGPAKCKRSYDKRCYDTPRTVSMNKCVDRENRVCDKLTEKVPYPVEKQVCHEEVKKVCELKEHTEPKQVKKYVYIKDCQPSPRTVCDNADVKKLVQSCVPLARKQCSVAPVEKCEDVPKQHCYKEFKRVKKQRCENNYS